MAKRNSTEKEKKEIGLQIRVERTKQQLRLIDLAKKIGYCVSSISDWETGKREPGGVALQRMHKLGMKIIS